MFFLNLISDRILSNGSSLEIIWTICFVGFIKISGQQKGDK